MIVQKNGTNMRKQEMKEVNNMKLKEKEQLLKKITELQKKVEKLEVESESPFYVKGDEKAYYIGDEYGVNGASSWNKNEIKTYIPCKNKDIIKNLANQAKLNTLLEKFAYENNANVTEEDWENIKTYKYYIYEKRNSFGGYGTGSRKYTKITGTIFFKSREAARRAINEVVVPFMEDKEE